MGNNAIDIKNLDGKMPVPGHKWIRGNGEFDAMITVPGWGTDMTLTDSYVLWAIASLEKIGKKASIRNVLRYMIDKLHYNMSKKSVQSVHRSFIRLADKGHIYYQQKSPRKRAYRTSYFANIY